MTTTPFDEVKQEKDEFEKLLEEAFLDEQFDISRFNKGDMIEAKVLDISDTEVFLDIGQKLEGICPLEEFEEKPTIGQKIKVVVIKSGGIEGNSVVSRLEAAKREAWNRIREANKNNLPLSGKIIEEHKNKKGFIVAINGIKLYLPKSEIGIKIRNKIPKVNIGDQIDFKILKIDEERKTGIISRKKIQEDINQEKWEKFLSKYKEGDIVEGTITKIISYGMFIRVEDLDGFIHQNDISWKSDYPFRKNYRKGDRIKAKILSINPEENKISLGIKQLTEDPWEWAKRELTVGSIVSGVITDIKVYGAFLEIREGLEGLIHNSEISWSKKKVNPRKYFKKGMEVEAKILAIDPEKKRISLSYKEATENPWNKITEILKVGEIREGKITGIVKYGAFVKIFDDIEGLIRVKDYSWDKEPDKNMLKKGDVVKFKILSIDPENRKISCGIKQLEPSPFEKLAQKYPKGEVLKGKITSISDFGIFVDIGDGYEGLVHKSKIPLKKNEKIEDKYKIGDEIQAVLLKIDPVKEKISLSIKDYERKKAKEIVKQYNNKEDQETYTLGAILKDELN
ncbi:MAG: S1 RNA-binding domain-containing protein [Leptospiraceae bacterium]|nr:S1 RNA-binding domain-containing protein [Leptospiraceae bacterium]MDW7976464.1 S1 RNA-binding domain-containing protein [Leptospiraceae bacterium]